MDWVVVFNSSFLAYYFYSNQWREWKNNMQTNQEKKESERLGWGAETVWDTILYVWFHQSLMRVMEFRLLDYNFSLTAEISLRASCSKCQSTSARTWNSMDFQALCTDRPGILSSGRKFTLTADFRPVCNSSLSTTVINSYIVHRLKGKIYAL